MLSNGIDWTHSNIPSPLSPSFIALNKNTGEFEAEDNVGIGPRIFHGQWSSPSAGTVNGETHLYFGGGDGWLYAFGTKTVTGENNESDESDILPEIWRFDCNPPEYRWLGGVVGGTKLRYGVDDPSLSEILSTPVLHNNRIYVALAVIALGGYQLLRAFGAV